MELDVTHCNSDAPFNPILGYHHHVSACLIRLPRQSFLGARSSIFTHWTNTTLGCSENKCLLPSTVELSGGLCIFIGSTKFGFTSSWMTLANIFHTFVNLHNGSNESDFFLNCISCFHGWCGIIDVPTNVSYYRIWAFLHQIFTCKPWKKPVPLQMYIIVGGWVIILITGRGSLLLLFR